MFDAVTAPGMSAASSGAGFGAIGSIVGSLAQAGVQIGTGFAAKSTGDRLAAQTRARGEMAASDERREGRRLIAKQRAAAAANGVEIDTGSILDIIAETAMNTEIDELRARLAADEQAEEFERAGENARTTGIFASAATLLGASDTVEDVFRGSFPGVGSSGVPASTRRPPARR